VFVINSKILISFTLFELRQCKFLNVNSTWYYVKLFYIISFLNKIVITFIYLVFSIYLVLSQYFFLHLF